MNILKYQNMHNLMIFCLKQTHKSDLYSVGAHCWCSGIMQDSHSCDPGSIPGQCTQFFSFFMSKHLQIEKKNAEYTIKMKIRNGSGMAMTWTR